MISNRPKRHHYIPQMLLKNFLDDSGRLWVYDKIRRKIYRTIPKNVFVEKDLYTTYSFDHVEENIGYEEFLDNIEKNYEYETRILGEELESKAAPIILRIIEQARCKQCPQLSPEQAVICKRFVLAMARRTPESQERVSSGKYSHDTFYEIVKTRADELNYDLPDKVTFYQDPRILKIENLIKSNVNAKFAVGDNPNERNQAEQFLSKTGLCVAAIHNPRRSFVIGSHGLAIVQSSYKNDPAQGAWLPIAHDVAVAPTAFRDREFLLPLDRDSDSIIEKINRASAAQSRIIAGRSKALICSLM